MSENIRESLEKLSKVGTEEERLLPCVLLRMLDDFKEVKTEIGEVKTGISEVKSEIGEVKTGIDGLSAEIGEVKTGIDGLSAEIGEVKAGIDGVKTETGEIKVGIDGVSTEIGEVKSGIDGVKTETGKIKMGIDGVNGNIKAKIGEVRTAQRKEIRIMGICVVIIIPLVVIAGIFWLSGQ